jgi:small subunit ribosomal protein S1
MNPGDIVTCKVIRLNRFGAFVELDSGREGIIHITELADLPVRHPEEVVSVGDCIKAKVLRDEPTSPVGLSRKRAKQS